MRKVLPYYLRLFGVFLITVFFAISCDKYADVEKYQRPEWLVGKLYTQISSVPEMSMFTQCLEDVGYDEILDRSGTYAAFVPTDSAFRVYLNGKSLDDMADEEKLRLVKSHILQMPWAESQLQSLSSRGWINLNDENNNKPLAFKRQTLMRNPNKTYPVKIERVDGKDQAIIVPVEESTDERVVYSNSRKYAPLFFSEFLTASELTGADYSYYYDRSFDPAYIYYMGARVAKDELFADNGFVYTIDKVTEPLLNAEELMEKMGHTAFLNLIHLNSDFDYNETQTLLQDGASEGLEVDELFDLSYDNLSFDIHDEIVRNARYTLEYHRGIIVPNNNAVQSFVNAELVGPGKWNDYDDIPLAIKGLLLNTHMSQEPIYQKDVVSGFYNALGDRITLDPTTITDKVYGSNVTYIATDKMIKPVDFESISYPLYTSPLYETFLSLYANVKLLSLLKSDRLKYSFFIIDDASIGVAPGDESLIQEWTSASKRRFTLMTLDPTDGLPIDLEYNDYEKMAYGQVGVQEIKGVASKEYVETLDGRHIILDHTTNTMTGGKPSVFGYNGSVVVDATFTLIDDYKNGSSYLSNAWLQFTSTLSYTEVKNHPTYLSLMKKAGLADNYSLTFVSPGVKYTLLIPSEAALSTAQLDTLPVADLKSVLQYHILSDEFLFTDGRQGDRDFETMNAEKTMAISTEPLIDALHITQTDGTVHDIVLQEGVTNIIGTKSGPDNYPITDVVMHEISTVLK